MKLLLYNLLMICLIFVSLAACSQSQNPSPTTISEDLNAKNQKAIANAINSVYVKYSDLIEGLKTKKTHEEFSSYIDNYEDYKGSSIDPSVKIFFFDPSKLPENHVTKIMHGICFRPALRANFIFIDRDYWLNTSPTDILLSNYSMHDLLSDGTIEYKNSILGNRVSRQVELYQELSEEDKQSRIDTVRELEEGLSDEEKLQATRFRRELLLFHELGHCDLNRRHEINTDSIMNYSTMNLLREDAIKEKKCPEGGPYLKAVKKCAKTDFEVSYKNLIWELFSPPQNISQTPTSPTLIRFNPEAQRLWYQEELQYMQIYTQAIDNSVTIDSNH